MNSMGLTYSISQTSNSYTTTNNSSSLSLSEENPVAYALSVLYISLRRDNDLLKKNRLDLNRFQNYLLEFFARFLNLYAMQTKPLKLPEFSFNSPITEYNSINKLNPQEIAKQGCIRILEYLYKICPNHSNLLTEIGLMISNLSTINPNFSLSSDFAREPNDMSIEDSFINKSATML